MKLVLATPLYPPEPGGPATYAQTLMESLPGQGVEVRLIKFSDVRSYPKGVRHIVYAFRVFVAALTADLVYVLDPVSTGVPAWIGAMCAGKSFYVRIGGDYAWEQGTQRFGVTETLDEFVLRKTVPVQVQLLRFLQRFIAKRARRVVVPSNYLKKIVETWGVRADCIRVVYNAPPPLPPRSSLEHPSGITGPYLITICRLVSWKGVDTVIRALHLLIQEGSTLSFVIVGSGPEEERLRTLAKELDIEDRVIFAGPLTPALASAYVAHAKALILNTRYEGFSHVILEAFALGVPVLTTFVGGNPEQVEDGVSGLMFSYGDVNEIQRAIERLEEEPNLSKKLITGGTKRLGIFTREQVIVGTRRALSLL